MPSGYAPGTFAVHPSPAARSERLTPMPRLARERSHVGPGHLVFRGGWLVPLRISADILVPLAAHAGKEPCHARMDLLDVRRPVRRHRPAAAALPHLRGRTAIRRLE